MIELGFQLGLGIGFAAAAVYISSRCVFRIEQGHLGVLTTFGKADFANEAKKELRTWGPGLHFKLPWQLVRKVSMMEQSIDLSGEHGGITAMANDGTILRLDSKLRFTPTQQELYDFLFALKDPLGHIQGLFRCLLRNEIANFETASGGALAMESGLPVGSYSMIRRERKMLNQHIEQFTREKIGGKYGLKFDAVDLTDIHPPDELADALNAVFNAQAEADGAYARAQAECQQRVMSSEKGVAIAAAKASAAEIEILGLGGYLSKLNEQGILSDYVLRRRTETLSESRTVFVRRSS